MPDSKGNIDLFKYLGTRLKSENNLSDFSFAFLQTIDPFGICFLEFVLKTDKKDSEIILNIEREYKLDSKSQVDLVIRTNDKVIIIENKLKDRNYHFKQYNDSIELSKKLKDIDKSKIRKFLISDHRIEEKWLIEGNKNGFIILYWADFYDFLKMHVKALQDSDCKFLLEGYLVYLKEVVDLRPIELIKFSKESLCYLYYFSNLLRKLVLESDLSNSKKPIQLKVDNNNSSSCGDHWHGIGYSLKNIENNREAWLSFYIQFYHQDETEESPFIEIQLKNKSNKDYIIQGLNNLKYSRLSLNAKMYILIKDKEGFAFKMQKELYNKLLQSNKKEEQEIILKTFFDEVNLTLGDIMGME